MSLVELVLHYENAIVRLRTKEANDDCVDSQTIPVAVTRFKDIEVAASHVFTAANFYMVQEELKKIGGLDVIETHVGLDSVQFIVAWKNNGKSQFTVEYIPKDSEKTITCSCDRMTRKGIPCKHVLYVLYQLKISDIPQCCVLRRLSKKARFGLPANRESDMFGWG
jgi:zinc finger SWIM domain-containing protein 3